MTGIDVASDAVKIGLGALLGGLFAYVLANQAYTIRRRESIEKRRLDKIETLAERFDKCGRELLLENGKMLSICNSGSNQAERQVMMAGIGYDEEKSVLRYLELIGDLHSIEIQLELLGLAAVKGKVEQYRNLCRTATTIELVAAMSEDQRRAKILETETTRMSVIRLLGEAYRKS